MSSGLDFQAILSAILYWRWKHAFAIALGALTTLLLEKNGWVDGASVFIALPAAISAWFLVTLILELAGKAVWRCGTATVTTAATWRQKNEQGEDERFKILTTWTAMKQNHFVGFIIATAGACAPTSGFRTSPLASRPSTSFSVTPDSSCSKLSHFALISTPASNTASRKTRCTSPLCTNQYGA
jgi:hypothetical protein